jgi:hypothetical protein
LEDGNLYLRLRTISHTIYAAIFEQTIIHQHVHLRRESQSEAPAHVLMRIYTIDKSLVCLVRFVLDQHAALDFYNASSLKQQSAGRYVAPLVHIILIPSHPIFALSP